VPALTLSLQRFPEASHGSVRVALGALLFLKLHKKVCKVVREVLKKNRQQLVLDALAKAG